MTRFIQSKRIHLVRKFPADVVASIQGSRILQVLSNLIANALEAMPEEANSPSVSKSAPAVWSW